MGEGGLGDRAWHVLLIGGASGVGKSALAKAIVRQHPVGTAEVDDLLVAVRAATTGLTHPALHERSPHDATADAVVELQIAIAEVLQPSVQAVVNTHLDHGPRVVIEGDYLLPGVLDQHEDWTSVSAVFVHEPDESRIAANLAAREPTLGNQDARAHASWLFGEHLCREAAARGVPILEARPWTTQLERVADLLCHD